MFGSAAVKQPRYNPSGDKEVGQPPEDGISCLVWSPAENYLVAGSWDNKVRCYAISPQGESQPKAMIQHTQPVLSCAWNADGSTVFSAGCDKTAKMWNIHTNQQQQVAQHDAPIRHCMFSTQLNMLITGGWDKTIKYWDLRQSTPVATVNLSERVYAMDVNQSLMVVGLADRSIQVYNLSNPQAPYATLESPLKWQTRCVACFPDQQGYLIGSIEGRVAVHHVDASRTKDNFTFKCHRVQDQASKAWDIYAVNHIAFNMQHGTFVTAGSDGTYNFWDKDSKQRLKAMPAADMPITCGGFNKMGNIYAYAVSYDWSKGYAHYNPAQSGNHILLHAVNDNDVKPRPKTNRR